MSINYARIAEKIQRTRKMKKLTQADMADLTGFAVSHISHLETHRRNVSLESLIRIASALNVTVDQLLEGNQTRNPHEYRTELFDLMADCSPYEKAVICATVIAIKQILRQHNDLLPHGDIQ